MQWSRVLPLAASAIMLGCSAPSGLSETTGAQDAELYALRGRLWPHGIVPVCWDSEGNDDEKGWVESAAERTWASVAAVRFVGWTPCPARFAGARLAFEDGWPRTLGLGTQTAGVPRGVLLNASFENWGRTCSAAELRRLCVEAVAVHELGHVLGFAHEQNRPDTPESCPAQQGDRGDETLGPWDLHSVMNYCNPLWNNGGQLSARDVDGARRLYGFPGWQRDARFCRGGSVAPLPGSAPRLVCTYGPARGEVRRIDLRRRAFVEDTPLEAASCQLSSHRLVVGARGVYCLDVALGVLRGGVTGPDFSATLPCAARSEVVMTDVDGNGADDAVCIDGNGAQALLASSEGVFGPPRRWAGGPCAERGARLIAAEGRLLCHGPGGEAMVVAGPPLSALLRERCRGSLLLGDVDGDGHTEVLCNSEQLAVFTGFAAPGRRPRAWSGPFGDFCRGEGRTLVTVLADEDARPDLLCHDHRTGYLWLRVTPSSGL